MNFTSFVLSATATAVLFTAMGVEAGRKTMVVKMQEPHFHRAKILGKSFENRCQYKLDLENEYTASEVVHLMHSENIKRAWVSKTRMVVQKGNGRISLVSSKSKKPASYICGSAWFRARVTVSKKGKLGKRGSKRAEDSFEEESFNDYDNYDEDVETLDDNDGDEDSFEDVEEEDAKKTIKKQEKESKKSIHDEEEKAVKRIQAEKKRALKEVQEAKEEAVDGEVADEIEEIEEDNVEEKSAAGTKSKGKKEDSDDEIEEVSDDHGDEEKAASKKDGDEISRLDNPRTKIVIKHPVRIVRKGRQTRRYSTRRNYFDEDDSSDEEFLESDEEEPSSSDNEKEDAYNQNKRFRETGKYLEDDKTEEVEEEERPVRRNRGKKQQKAKFNPTSKQFQEAVDELTENAESVTKSKNGPVEMEVGSGAVRRAFRGVKRTKN